MKHPAPEDENNTDDPRSDPVFVISEMELEAVRIYMRIYDRRKKAQASNKEQRDCRYLPHPT